MISVDYRRWGLFRSNQIYFGEELPATAGYHFIVCDNCFSRLPYHPAFQLKERRTTIIDLTKDADALFKQMNRSRRRMIKEGLKIGYQITHQKASKELLLNFKRFYNKFIPAKGATPLVNLNSLQALIPYMTIFQANYAGRTLETMLLIHDNQVVRGFYQARDETLQGEKILKHIGSVLNWEIMMSLKERGYQIFDFGGVGVNDAIRYYKLSFGGEVIPTYNYEAALTPGAQIMLKIRNRLERQIRQIIRR